MSHFETVVPNVYRFRDLVNVYVIVRNGFGLAIELGRGHVLDHLDEIGVGRLEWVLHTHHHRDLCMGDGRAVSAGAKVAIPESEAELFENAEACWDAWHIYVNYDLRSRRDAPRTRIPVSARLSPGEVFTWRGLEIRVLATPGHTDGSVSLLVNMDGRTFCFCGDALTSRGRVPTIHDLHWGYMPPGSGLQPMVDSLGRILDQEPDLLLPARGDSTDDVAGMIKPLREKLLGVIAHLTPNHAGRQDRGLHQVSERIWFLGCTTYCILLENGHALLWDYGYVDEGAIRRLRRDHGLLHVDAVAVSHYHDDHVGRIPELVHTVCRNQRPRPEVWVFENQAAIYSDPNRFNIPCLWPAPIPFDRVLSEDEVVDWHGVRLQFFHMPGQTEWHCGMVADLDGRRFAFTGDNLWKPKEADSPANGPIIWQNGQFLDGGTLKGFRKLRDLAPDAIMPAHTDPIDPSSRDYLNGIVAWAEQVRPMVENLVDQPHPEFGCDPFWVRFDPYRCEVDGATTTFPALIRVRNLHDHAAPVRLKPALPEGWRCSPASVEKEMPARSEAGFGFEVHVRQPVGRRTVLSVEVELDGVDYGEKGEMILDVAAHVA